MALSLRPSKPMSFLAFFCAAFCFISSAMLHFSITSEHEELIELRDHGLRVEATVVDAFTQKIPRSRHNKFGSTLYVIELSFSDASGAAVTRELNVDKELFDRITDSSDASKLPVLVDREDNQRIVIAEQIDEMIESHEWSRTHMPLTPFGFGVAILIFGMIIYRIAAKRERIKAPGNLG